MKIKWMIAAGVLSILIIGSGCGKVAGSAGPSGTATPVSDSGRPTGTGTAGVSEEDQKLTLSAFQALLKTPGNEKEAIAELRRKLPELSPENASQMVLAFEAYQTDAVTQGTVVTDDLIKLIQAGTQEPYSEKTLNDLSGVTDDALKNALKLVFDRGYKLIVPEGMYQAVIDYSVYKDFEKSVTPDLAAYIEIMARESDSRMLEDAGIIIPIDEVFAREELSSAFIGAYPSSVKTEQVKRMYNIYIDTYFYGQNNTPAFDYTSHLLNQAFMDSYKKAAETGTGSPAVNAVADYLKVLEKNNNELTSSVKKYRDNMTSKLKFTLKP